jgi:hypothetical protein
MTSTRRRALSIVAAGLGLAALLGGSLGVATAGVRSTPLAVGFNLVGGPLGGDVPPAAFVECLPAGSWSAVYIWDGTTQTWKHFFTGVPAYVNNPAGGGISIIPRFSGVVLIMKAAVSNPRLRDTASEPCSG